MIFKVHWLLNFILPTPCWVHPNGLVLIAPNDKLDEIARKDGFQNTNDFTNWFMCNPKFTGYAEAQRLTFELA